MQMYIIYDRLTSVGVWYTVSECTRNDHSNQSEASGQRYHH